MAIKIIDNVSNVQSVPDVSSAIVRDISKPLSFYLVGSGSGQWSATISLYEVDSTEYSSIGAAISFTVNNNNHAELFTWASNTKTFLINVSSITDASVTVYMTQAEQSQLERILLSEPSAGNRAMPSDIVGCTAEYVKNEGWVGNLGILNSKTILESLPINALVVGKVWAIVASADSFEKYNYMSAGWVLESSIGSDGYTNILGSITNPFNNTTERNNWAAANQSKLYVGYHVYLTGGLEYRWIGPAPSTWEPIQSYVPAQVIREAAVVRISGDGTAEPALGNLVNANMQVPYYGVSAAIIDREYYFIDVNHDYVDGTDITPHIHLVPVNSSAGNVKFSLYYQTINGGAVAQAPTLLTGTVAMGVPAWTEKRIDYVIPGAGVTKNARIMMHFFRDRNDAQDTYEAAVGVTSVSAHYWANPAQYGPFV